MTLKHHIKDSSINIFRLLWWAMSFVKNGTFSPTIKTIKPSNDRIFILGNGPSLTKDITPYLSQLQSEDVLMVNQSITTSLAHTIKPKYYVLMDPAYFGISCAGQNPQYAQKCIEQINIALAKITWQIYLCVPATLYRHKKPESIQLDNPLIHIKTFNSLELYTFKSIEKLLYKRNLAIPSGINVLIASLCCAIAMGYKYIYLLGADSNFLKMLDVDMDNKLYYVLEHFYEENREKHFVPMSLADNLACAVKAFKAYEVLGDLGFPIVNLTSTSMIDGFKRDSLQNVMGGGHKTSALLYLARIFILILINRIFFVIGIQRQRLGGVLCA